MLLPNSLDMRIIDMQNTKQFYINGHWVDPVSGTDFEVVDPSTEEAFATISLGGEADTQAAVLQKVIKKKWVEIRK